MPDETTDDDALEVDTGTGAPAGPGAESMASGDTDDAEALPSEMEGKG